MLPPPPPRREARNHLKPAAAFRIPASTIQLRYLRAAAIGHLHADKTVPHADRDRDRPARSLYWSRTRLLALAWVFMLPAGIR
jgi:hypothetical protein